MTVIFCEEQLTHIQLLERILPDMIKSARVVAN